MGKIKKIGKKGSVQSEVHSRHNYTDHSRRFLDWVDGLGFEQTPLGRLLKDLDRRLGLRRVSFLFLFSLVLSSLIFYDFDFSPQVKEGEVASADIKSPVSFQMVDHVATEAKRREAMAAVPQVYDYDPELRDRIEGRIYTAFHNQRQLLKSSPLGVEVGASRASDEVAIKDFLRQYKAQFEEDLGHRVGDRIFEWLTERRFNVQLENILIRANSRWLQDKLVDVDLPDVGVGPNSQVLLRVIHRQGIGEEILIEVSEFKDLRRLSLFTLEEVRGADQLRLRDQKNILHLAQSLLQPNVTLNRQETALRQQRASEGVLPIQISVQRNQTIISAGSVVQPSHVSILHEIRALQSDRRTGLVVLAAALLFMILILTSYSFMRRYSIRRIHIESKDLVVMGLVTLLTVAMTKVFLYMTEAAFVERFGDAIPSTVFLFAAPVAAAPMLVGLLIISGQVVWLFTIFMAFVLSLLADMHVGFFVVTLLGGMAAARGVHTCKTRNHIYWAGLRTGLINSAAISLVILWHYSSSPEIFNQLLWNVPAGLVSGLMAAMVAMMLVPLLESAFNYTTDVKLLELSSLNHPLMKEMIVKAPGTYHHSMVVGSMVEAAADLIGANALLAKVMAYYHDIGKMEHAQYFIENQGPSYNPHDHVSPYMSKTILIAHVKDGAEMALEHKLGKPIVDGILQHHGTTLISYFYNKALQEQDDDIDCVEEGDFRYPGPKPQFREAALVMLADSIEAAARALEEPTSSRLQNIVKNIIQTKFLDGQLDECNLTLKDLSLIEQSYLRVLLGIYHQRIDYPKNNLAPKSQPLSRAVVRGGGGRGSFSA